MSGLALRQVGGALGFQTPLFEEYTSTDPSTGGGLQRPIGWRVLKPDGTGSWDKTGAGATAWSVVGSGISGVTSFNGLVGAINFFGVPQVADLTHLAALSATVANGYDVGALVYVQTLHAHFVLELAALTTDGITRLNNAARAGTQWYRLPIVSNFWIGTYIATACNVDPQNVAASDEATGAPGAPLKTLSEMARRCGGTIPSGSIVNGTLLSSCANTDKPVWTAITQNGAATGDGIKITGTPGAPIYTGTITSVTASAAGPSTTDFAITDSGIPVSYTASGLIGTGLSWKRTNGTVLYMYGAKDKGSKTARISAPQTATPALGTLAPGDTYTVSQLPKIYDQTFIATTSARGARVSFVLCDDNSTAVLSTNPEILQPVIYDRCTFATAKWFSSAVLNNCAAWAAVGFQGAGVVRVGGQFLFVGGVALSVFNGCAVSSAGDIMLQGGSMYVGLGAEQLNVVSVSVYDSPNADACLELANGRGNAISYFRGSGNIAPLIYASGIHSGLSPGVTPFALDASTSASPSLQAGATTGNVAAVPLVDATALNNIARGA